jgi:hypothetical protein
MSKLEQKDPLFEEVSETTLNQAVAGLLGFLALLAVIVWNVSANGLAGAFAF